VKIRVTALQAEEIEHGMEVDADEEHPAWGQLLREYTGSRNATLIVTDVVNALWRITSLRDILRDNDAPQQANSIQRVVDTIVSEAGGRDAVLALPGATAICLNEYV
jgi:hypothetical protein